jgi:hypothetical protein
MAEKERERRERERERESTSTTAFPCEASKNTVKYRKQRA